VSGSSPSVHLEAPSLAKSRVLLLAAGLIATLLFVLIWLGPISLSTARFELFVTIFLGIFIEALPFLLIGVLASSLLQIFVSTERVQRLSPKSPALAALVGALMGLCFLPVCECGAVPAARRLLVKGAPVPLSIAFVLAAPAVNPVVIASTWVAFGGDPLFVFGRVGLTIVIAATVALLLGSHSEPDKLLAPQATVDHEHDHDHGRGVTGLFSHASAEFFEMGRFLVIGATIAATIQTVVPRQSLLALGHGAVVSALVLMALAVVLSICSTVDAFVALAFTRTFLPGSILAFLVFGPMIDIKSVLMFSSTYRRHVVALMVLLTAQLVLLAAVVINVT
jgi:uncharacterized membrane protein YraQ (UPF0718 family)